MKNKIQKGLIALLVTGLLGMVSGCGLFEWTSESAQSLPTENVSSETVSSEGESGISDENTDGEAQASQEGEPQPSVPEEESSEEHSSDGKIELPEDKFD